MSQGNRPAIADHKQGCHAARSRSPAPLPLFAGDFDGDEPPEPAVIFPAMTEGEAVVEDYVAMRLTLRRHPMALLRGLVTPVGA